jgi:predicted permease
MGRDDARPPLLGRLLLALCRLGDRRTQIEEDLLELFRARRAESGLRHARRRYRLDALSVWRHGAHRGERMAPSSRFHPFQDLTHDLRFAVRVFARQRTVIALTVAGLGLAIALSTTAFTVLNAMVFRPVGVADPDSAVRVWRRHRTGASTVWSYSEYTHLRERARLVALEGTLMMAAELERTPGVEGPRVSVALVDPGYFETFGGRAALGRLFGSADFGAAAPVQAVLQHRAWKNYFAGDPAVLGRTVSLSGVPVFIVGIAERGFTGPQVEPPALWLALTPARAIWPAIGPFTPGSRGDVSVAGHVRPGVTIDQAHAELNGILAGLPSEYAANGNQAVSGADVVPADNRSPQQTRLIATLVMTGVGLVVLLACANAANLLLAGATTRAREMSMRLALGAARWRLVRQLLTESVLLGVVAGFVGFVIAAAAVPSLAAMLQIPAEVDLAPDGRVYTFSLLVSVVVGLVAGLAPARHGTRGDLLSPIRSDSAGSGVTKRSRRVRSSFIGLQAASSVLLLVIAALFGRALYAASRVDFGFDVARLAAANVQFPRTGFDEARRRAFWRDALERVKALPGVERAGLAMNVPLTGSVWSRQVNRDGQGYRLIQNRVAADFFPAAGFRVVRGRTFTPDEVATMAPVAVITDNLARDFWGDVDPIGMDLGKLDTAWAGSQIVGVIAAPRTRSLRDDAEPAVYHPLTSYSDPLNLVVRARGEAGTIVKPVRDVLRAVEPGLQPNVWLVDARVRRDLDTARLLAGIAGVMGGLALVLSLAGLFGVTAFVVRQRTREMGVRVAIGATRADVVTLLLRDGLRPVMIGLAVGVGASLLASRAVEEALFGVSARDPIALVTAALLLFVTAALAVIVPARQASRIDPAVTLRE